MVKIKGYEFSLREFAGSLGDFGLLNPFILAFVAILGINPFGILLMMGIFNIIIGLRYNLPLPIEVQKAVGTYAINNNWTSSLLYGTGIGMGLVWIFLTYTKLINKISKVVPLCVIIGVQFGLGLMLAKEALGLSITNVWFAAGAIVVIILLGKNKFAPGALLVFIAGLIFALTKTGFIPQIQFTFPKIYIPHFKDILTGLAAVGLAQIVLTLSNAIMACSLAVNTKFPDNKISEKQLAANHGWMNTVAPIFGGVPMCHGTGGFASQYYFGARTGGSMIMEGIFEVLLAFFMSGWIFKVMINFPESLLGAMLLFTAWQLAKTIKNAKENIDFAILIGLISLFVNLGVGFIIGIVLYYMRENYRKHSDSNKKIKPLPKILIGGGVFILLALFINIFKCYEEGRNYISLAGILPRFNFSAFKFICQPFDITIWEVLLGIALFAALSYLMVRIISSFSK